MNRWNRGSNFGQKESRAKRLEIERDGISFVT
jgi:hypothetical protein